jgi:hypothetical protein
MQSRFLLSLICFFATTVTFSMNANIGKIVTHKEWSTGKMKVIFKEKEEKQSLLLTNDNLKEISPNGDYIFVNDTMPKIATTLKDDEALMGESNITIANNTSSNQTYTFKTMLCLGNYDEDGHYITTSCSTAKDVFNLYPDSIFSMTIQPHLLLKDISSGSYIATIYTEIKRDGQESVFASNAYGKIIITNPQLT